ncbi:MAG: CARDB domain-containing protein [Solirubrobacteraceae bacterium]|nr:CARDB domain-containing protein [Solirubrobacteraceae bacterium]
MLAPSSRPLRSLIVATALAAATATAAAAPASAAASSTHGTKAATATKAKSKAKKGKKVKRPVVGKADLVARNLSLDFLSDGFSIEAFVANTGKGRAGKSDVSVVLSSDELFDAGDDVLAEVPMNGQAGGTERRVQTEVEVPEELPDGDLYLLICADGNGDVIELKESNNCVSQLVASDSVGEDGSEDGDDGEGSDQAAIDDADDGQTV